MTTERATQPVERPPSAGTILLVEDNPITRRMLRVSLEIGGFDVVDAGDGHTALQIAGRRRPDLLVLDFVLPDMDGLQLLAEIRRRVTAPEVPAVIVTGMVSRLDELRARTGGPTHFLAKPVEPSRLLEAVRAQLASAEGRVGGKRILVVDDEVLNLKLASFRLRRAGYEVESASGGEEALAMARRRCPDAILSDVMMPSMDGFSFCREARKDAGLRKVPIVLVSSAYVDEADRELARQMGASALVVRTPDLRDATAALAQSLRGTALVPSPTISDGVTALHRERLQVQLERQTAHNEKLLRQAAIQATALSLIRGLSEVLAQPRDVPHVLGDVLAHCLDAAGLSTGLLYMAEAEGGGHHRLQAQFGVPSSRKADAEQFFGHPELMRRIVAGGHPVALSPGKGVDAETRDFLTRLGHSSALILPFVVLGETFGELVLASDDHDLTDDAWMGFARSLALQFGQTVALGQSLKRLAASEARYRALMEHASDAIFVLDPWGTILEANQQAETLLALPRDQMIGRPIASFSPPGAGQTPEHVSQFQEVLAAGGGRVDNVAVQRGDGALVEVDFSMSVSESDGKASVLSIGRDVTERNRAAAALRDAQQRLHHVVSSSPAVLYSLRFDGDTLVSTWVSDNVLGVTGFTSEEVAGTKWWSELVHPDDQARVVAHPARLTPGTVAREYRFRHKDGGYRWVHDEQVLIKDADGQPEVIGSWSDVTGRKDAELRLKESEEQYRLLFDSNPYPMWVIDLETLAFMAVNDAAVSHYGWSREEFLRMTPADIRVPEAVPEFLAIITGARGAPRGQEKSRSSRHRKRDGTEIEVELVATSIVFQGRPARLALVADVTEKSALQAQLVQSQKMDAVGQLAGGVAHDFNNLLGVITGYSELLIRELAPESRARKRAEEVKHAADRAAALTRQLLAFGRRQVLQPKVLDLNEIVSEVEKMLQRLITETIQIVSVGGVGLGRVRADAGQIEQVLMNLAINARDAMPSGGRLVIETANAELDEAYVRTHPEAHPGRYVVLVVTDTGQGMDARTMSRIFEPFFTTKEEGKGTGLGLATVYGIVRQSGGTVDVYSEPGHGTAFKVYLPRVDEDVERAAGGASAVPAGGAETILLVEDAEALRVLVRELLESSGYTVLDSGAPEGALALVQSTASPIDLILTDMVMPGMSGPELAKQITALKPKIRVVFMSGYSEQIVGDAGTLAPGAHFLQKPFKMNSLLTTIRAALDADPPAGKQKGGS
jgi:two-component system, cell cycle sensor histidine kinase and response regulator CckA